MIDITTPRFDKCRIWIDDARNAGVDWDDIRLGLEADDTQLMSFLINQVKFNFWPPELDVETWKKIVDSERQAEEEALTIEVRNIGSVLVENDTEGDVTVPLSPQSSWQLYKQGLLKEGWKENAVNAIEEATLDTLKKLNADTSKTGPIKGLIIGHVQSGKTANMAALLAMAADWQWNFFVVLSGTIENLRKQTQRRLMNDLNKPGHLFWEGLEQLSVSGPGRKVQELHLGSDSKSRYFTVCLKNATRLKNLIEWAQRDLNKYRQMKMIIIDDEADQASINTAGENRERARINQLIINLVEGKTHDSKDVKVKPQAINYISYTATPYANILNESSEKSLYPRNFIRTLNTSNEYFGPAQIFGVEGLEGSDGLDIIRDISSNDLTTIKLIHESKENNIPDSMKNALCWFLCAAAAMRVREHKKPVSMLIHTSQKQNHHGQIYNKISSWLSASKVTILQSCEKLWEEEKERFTIKDFRRGYPDYGRTDSEISDYPAFEEIAPHIQTLVSQISPIKLDEENNTDLKYHSGTHICIDNCANNGINDEGEHVRLAYPESPLDGPAPAFIVIGGSTLSRGLTIEGLVSTYFLRASCQVDTLMQMGRWFGYRKGYELLPRIWMHANTVDKFRFLSLVEHELREQIAQYMVIHTKPSEFGPKVLNSPDISWMRITAKNKMQSAIAVDMDFTGSSTQTITFKNDHEILKENLETTESFLGSLGDGEVSHLGNSIVWRNIEFDRIRKSLFDKFNFHPRSKVFNDLDSFSQWMENVTRDDEMDNWNVVVAGNGKVVSNSEGWKFKEGTVGLVNRSKKKNQTDEPDLIYIGALRAPSDLYADIPDSSFVEKNKSEFTRASKAVDVYRIRTEGGLEKTPQLIIYRIDKNSKAKESSNSAREDLNADFDIIGFSMLIPGARKNKNLVRTITVKIENVPEEQRDNWEEDE